MRIAPKARPAAACHHRSPHSLAWPGCLVQWPANDLRGVGARLDIRETNLSHSHVWHWPGKPLNVLKRSDASVLS